MKKLLPFFLLFFALNTFSQKEANFWYFGENAGLDFSSGKPVALTNGLLNTTEGCSTISTKDGELLFYSDGIILYNKNHEIMKFSDGTLANSLAGNSSSTQSALFVPNPEDENIYYLFTVGTDYVARGDVRNPGFNYYTIDKTKGEIINGPINLAGTLSDSWSEKVTAVQGDDCKSIWIVSAVNNQFYSYKITKGGVDVDGPVSPSNTDYSLADKRGYLKVSPDGKKIAMADFNSVGGVIGLGSLVLYDFNSITGKVSKAVEVLTNSNSDGDPYGVEFSQNSSKLYVTTLDDGKNNIFQFDLTDSNISRTKTLIFSQDGYRSAIQLAPDGKIYNSIPGNNFLGAIENPNDEAREVRYTVNAISLGSARATQGLPPFIQSFFSPVNIVDGNNPTFVLNKTKQSVCIDDVVVMEPELIGNSSSTYKWTKKDNPAVIVNSRKITIDNTNFGSGQYNLEMSIEDICGRIKKYNSSVEIEFIPKPILNNIPVFEQCDFDSDPNDYITNFNLELKEKEIYDGLIKVDFEFYEESDTSFLRPLPKNDYRNSISARTGNHKLIVRIQVNGSLCFITKELELKVNPSGIDSYSKLYACELDINKSLTASTFSLGNGDAVFDFDTKTNNIILDSGGALSLSTHNFRYYRSKDDARLQINEIKKPYDNDIFKNDDDVFIKISLKNTDACESIGQFKLQVQELPIPKGNPSTITLCVANPIINPQPITTDLDGGTGIATDTYLWYRNNQIINGATNATYKANQEGTYKVEAYRAYINNPTDTSDDFSCTGFNTFTVNESNAAFIESIDFKDDQDNSNENAITINISGKGTYEYAINSQTSSSFNKGLENLSYTFNNVKPGLNTIYINDVNGCGITASKEISFVYFKRFFTPNGDNVNDSWTIEGVNNSFYKEVKLEVFDRYGRFLKSIDLKSVNGWNGLFNGKLMPENNYWYNATLVDINNNVRNKKGYFSLLRK